MQSPTELFRDWHDFYLLVGTASATLVGLMFVATSIGSSLFTHDKQSGMSAFVGSTVVHFSAVLVTCILSAMPLSSWQAIGGLIAATGLACLGYAGRIWMLIFIRRSFPVDWMDRLYYGVIPVLGYLLVLAAGVLLLMRSAVGAEILAAAVLTLLLAGIHNAWDMMTWIVIRTGNPPAPPAAPGDQPSP